MDETTYKRWWPLHLRVACGESLGSDEQADYEDGLKQLHQEENLNRDLDALRQVRATIRKLDTERHELETHRRQLEEKIATLESGLSEQTRQALGIGD